MNYLDFDLSFERSGDKYQACVCSPAGEGEVDFTSPFTESRFHPILRSNLPHTGVDFAAQRGTPVRAVGDGIIGNRKQPHIIYQNTSIN